jgi:hypothetical protein
LKASSFDIHKAMLKAHDFGTMSVCWNKNFGESVDASTGLVGGHAYSVTKVVVAQTNDGDEKVCETFVKRKKPENWLVGISLS